MGTSVSYKKIWTITYPIIIGSIAQNIVTLTDTAFLGRVSESALGAVAIAGLLYIVYTMLAWGFSIGIQIAIARRYGERNFNLIGKTFVHGLGFVILLSILLFSSIRFNSSVVLDLLINSESVYNDSAAYLNIRSWGIFFACINYLYRGLYIGITNTRVISISTVFMAVINIVLDYILIFGKFNFSPMGIEGAATASLIAEIGAMLFFTAYSLLKLPLKKFNFFGTKKFDKELLVRLIRLSIPTMLQSFISFACWFLFFVFIEHLGERALASSNIVRSIYMIVLLPVWSYGATANTLTSQLIGAGRRQEIIPMLWKIAKMSVVSVVILNSVALIFPYEAISIYTDNKELAEFSLSSIYIVSGASVSSAIAITFFEAISGTGNTLKALLLEFSVLILYIFYTWYLSHYLTVELKYIWTADYVYSVLLGIISYLYMKRGKWKILSA